MPRIRVGLALVLLSCWATAALAQTPAVNAPDPGPVPKYVADPIALMPAALGPFHRPISSKVPEAQQFFDQGFQMMYAFARLDAVRSFREAWKRDPSCAICYWGEAWAWGSYLNGPMPAEQSPFAYYALQKAISLKAQASPIERDFIDALTPRYVPNFDPKTRRVQDEAYAESMRKLAEKHPNDLDAVTLYGDALFLLEPRRGRRDVNAPNIKRLHGVLESVLARDNKHTGACHLYVHATESTQRPSLAEACAEFLGDSIPGASHIQHMPSHTWNEVGRWSDSVRSNLEAWHSDLKADIGEGFAIYPEHNLHMLLYAAAMDGQGAIAVQAGRDYAKRTGDTVYHVLTLIRFGRFDEVLEVTKKPERHFPQGAWEFAQGYARLKLGEPDYARLHLDRVRKLETTTQQDFRSNPTKRLLGVLTNLLEGEMLVMNKQTDAAIPFFEKAVQLDDELEYDEPEPLPFPARHWLGAALIELKRYAEAEKVYRDELDQHPHNGWSLLGLKQALAGQGKKDAAVDADFEKSWARADHWVRFSRF